LIRRTATIKRKTLSIFWIKVERVYLFNYEHHIYMCKYLFEKELYVKQSRRTRGTSAY
jgi:hypothetical protein